MSKNLTVNQQNQIRLLTKYRVSAKDIAEALKLNYAPVATLVRVFKLNDDIYTPLELCEYIERTEALLSNY